MKKARYLFAALVLFTITPPAMAGINICLSDGFGYVWTISGTNAGGGNWNLSGSVANVGTVDWIVTGVANPGSKTISITATNPSPDFCTLSSDYFTYDGNVVGKHMTGTWVNNCGGSGTWSGQYKMGGCPTLTGGSVNVIDGPARPHGQSSGSVELRNSGDLSGSDFFDEALSMHSYPNPVSNQATISYTLFDDNLVNITIYNSMGEQVAVVVNAQQAAGAYSVNWNVGNASGSRVSNGVYFVRIQTKTGAQTTAITVE